MPIRNIDDIDLTKKIPLYDAGGGHLNNVKCLEIEGDSDSDSIIICVSGFGMYEAFDNARSLLFSFFKVFLKKDEDK